MDKKQERLGGALRLIKDLAGIDSPPFFLIFPLRATSDNIYETIGAVQRSSGFSSDFSSGWFCSEPSVSVVVIFSQKNYERTCSR